MSKQKDEAIYRKGWDDGFAKGATAARFQLEAENAKLRELVHSLYEFAHIEYPDGTERMFAGKLRELGVEV